MLAQQAPFDETYHHIEAPTVSDEEYGKLHKKRRLKIPREIPYSSAENIYRTDELLYLEDCKWEYKRKLDGQNIRIKWDGERVVWNGKTNNFQCGQELHTYMEEKFLEEIFEEHFGREKTVLIFGENMGKGVQGNELGLDKQVVIIYDVKVGGTWLNREDIEKVASYFNVQTCFDFMLPYYAPTATLRSLINRVACGVYKDWEGIVAVPVVGLKDRLGKRIIVKIKNKDYLK